MNISSEAAGRLVRARFGGRAFTLVELLVVLAVLAVLASLLIPAVARAKGRARSVQCLNNLRQWVIAFQWYSDDFEFLPREGHRTDGTVRVDNWANVNARGNGDVWYNALPPLLDERPASAYASLLSGERPRFYESRLFHCPSARFPPGAGRDNDAFFSLVMNSKLIIPPNDLREHSLPFSAIQIPSATAAFLEARVSAGEFKVDPGQLDYDLGQPSAFSTRFAARHNRGGNLAFCDGHVAWMPGAQVVETRPGQFRGFARFPDGPVIWCADPLVDPNTPDGN